MISPKGGAMRIRREGGVISMWDSAAPFWLLGLFLLAGGITGMAMPLGLATNPADLEPWERLTSLLIGMGVSSGALWWLTQHPGTMLRLDLTRRSVTVVRWGILGRRTRQLRFDQLEGVEVEESKDSDGDPMWRPVVRLRGGAVVRLSELWEHDERGVRASLAVFAESCGLPRTAEATLSPG
ncbi:MAG TPA: hypothetical protein VKB22_01980 [Gemmatimonadales bacterium]|nr:hypothetical protein [Gemmatimonadales bacterium]